MGIGDTIKGLFEKLKQNVVYECDACDYETQRKHFETDGGSLECPNCGSDRGEWTDTVHIDAASEPFAGRSLLRVCALTFNLGFSIEYYTRL